MNAARRPVIAALLSLSLAGGTSRTYADMLPPAEQVPAHEQVVQQRSELRARLEAHGVDKNEAEARVRALSDAEASKLSAEFDKLPAGGDPRAVLGAVGVFAIAYVVIKLLPLFLIGGAVVIAAKSANKNPA